MAREFHGTARVKEWIPMELFCNLQNKLQRARQYCRQFGIRKTFVKVFKAISSKMYDRRVSYIILAKELAEETKCSFDRKIRVEVVEKRNLGILQELCKTWDDKNASINSFAGISDYFEKGYHGFIAYLNDDIIGYFWWVGHGVQYKRRHPDLPMLDIELKEKEAYGFDYFIPPEHRGNGNAVEFLYKIFSTLNKLGYDRLFGVVEPTNTPARWLYKIVGFKDARRITSCRLLNSLLFMGKKVFLKTSQKYLYAPFGFRAVYPFKNRKSLNERRGA